MNTLTRSDAFSISLAERADALRAVKYLPPLAEGSSYSVAYTEGLAALAAEVFDHLGDIDQVGDTLRAAGVVGHTIEGRMVGESRAQRLNPVSAWLHSLFGPGHYEYFGGSAYQIDLEVHGGDTEDAGTIPVPDAVAEFLDVIEDPFDDEVHRYRGLTVDDAGRPAIYLGDTEVWVCAAINAQDPHLICAGPVPCPEHPAVPHLER